MLDREWLRQYQCDLLAELKQQERSLSQSVKELEARLEESDKTAAALAQQLARMTSPLDPTSCPACAIRRGRHVELVAASNPGDDEPQGYFRCAEECGFDNRP